ncbi:MAG: hypothetical protein JWR35_1669 [Marmoricola sp.]|jgi:hypothetical protein|nr:hypothetical protein [Marmoricola sp.]
MTVATWRNEHRGVVRVIGSTVSIELAALVALGVTYTFIRAGQGNDAGVAIAHAHHILSIEGPIFGHLERPLNQWLVGLPALAVPACYFYALMHYAVTPTVLLVSRRSGGWSYWRGYWALMIASAIALVIYARYPVAPPRLVPDIDVVDVMRRFASYGWWGSAASAPRGIGDATNQFAAMPSLHFGWSLWCGIQMWGFRSKLWRIPAIVYPTLQVIVVLGTANHFFLDVLGGGACVLVAYAVVGALKPFADRSPAAEDSPSHVA